MKKLGLLIALTVPFVALPALPDQTTMTTPEVTLEQIFAGPSEPIDLMPMPIPMCDDIRYTLCTSLGATRTCTDACHYTYTCSCQTYYEWNGSISKRWKCPEVC